MSITECEMSIPEYNGFVLCGKVLPDIALENLLASVPVDDLLKLREVCQVWRDILLRRTFWKNVAERNGIDWNSIPNHIKESDRGWIVFYAACKNKIFRKNFIQNHSGHDQFAYWQKLQDHANNIIVESPPLGIEPLPKDPRYASVVDSAFVFSYDWGVLQQTVPVKQVGLTKEIMRTIIPFQFVATQMIGSRFDCGGCFCVCLCLLDKKGEAIQFNMTDNVIPAGANWIESTCTLNVVKEFERFDEVQYLAILICGKDSQYWDGHFGTKHSRISVSLNCLSSVEAENVTPPTKFVANPQNAHVFIGNFWQNLLPNRPMGRCPYSRQPRN